MKLNSFFKRTGALALSTLFLLGGSALGSAAAYADERPTEYTLAGDITWGIKCSWRNYLHMKMFKPEIHVMGNISEVPDTVATESDEAVNSCKGKYSSFKLAQGSGTYNATTHAMDVAFQGGWKFLSHPEPGKEGAFLLDETLTNPRLKSEGNKVFFLVDYRSRDEENPSQYKEGMTAKLAYIKAADLASKMKMKGSQITVDEAPVYFAEKAPEILGAAYQKDMAVSKMSFSFTATPKEQPKPEAKPVVSLAKSEVQQGETLSLKATGFKPNSEVTFEIHSEVVSLTAQADGEGIATTEWNIPADFEVGDHSVTVRGMSPKDKEIASEVASFKVIEKADTDNAEGDNGGNGEDVTPPPATDAPTPPATDKPVLVITLESDNIKIKGSGFDNKAPGLYVGLAPKTYDSFYQAYRDGVMAHQVVGEDSMASKAAKWISTANDPLCTDKIGCIKMGENGSFAVSFPKPGPGTWVALASKAHGQGNSDKSQNAKSNELMIAGLPVLQVARVVVSVASVDQGKKITFTASGFKPNSKVDFEVHSDVVKLSATANAAGVASTTWKVPVAFAVGEHRVIAMGMNSADKKTTAETSFKVTPGSTRYASAGNFRWAIKDSFRNYIRGGIAKGDWQLSGVQDNGSQFVWNGSGVIDKTTHVGNIALPGSIHFTGHHGALDLTLSNMKLAINGNTGTIYVNYSSKDMSGNVKSGYNVAFASLDLSRAKWGDKGVSVESAPAVLLASGEPAFAGFWKAGQVLSPASFNFAYGERLPNLAHTGVDGVSGLAIAAMFLIVSGVAVRRFAKSK